MGSINFQARDYEVLSGLFESRFMAAKHISEIHFAGKSEMAKKAATEAESCWRHFREPSFARSDFNRFF